MKKLLVLTIAVLFICAASVMADVPHMINYQGYLTDTGGEALDTTVAMTFTMYDAATLGTQLWTETQPACSVREGLFNVLLGSVSAIPNSVFEDTVVWLGITVGGDSEMDPHTQVASVAYAYRVETVDGATGGIVSGKLNIGSGNTNAGDYAFVVGENNSAMGNYASVIGGFNNDATGPVSMVSGGSDNEAYGFAASVGGGAYNNADGNYSAVSGGSSNTADAHYSIVGGGRSNRTSSEYSTVGGGRYNFTRGDYSVVAGGGGATLTDSNSAVGQYSVVGGGNRNAALYDMTTVCGGQGNTGAGNYSVISGGYYNRTDSIYTTIGGGLENEANGYGATIAGGDSNRTFAPYAAVAGGKWNTVTGDYAMIPGGYWNTAQGDYSFAAGRRAKAELRGCFRWADSYDADFSRPDEAENSFSARASGGVYFYTNTSLTSGLKLNPGGSTWIGVSDSTKKRNIRLVDTGKILEKVAQLPIKQWSYKSQDPSIEHIGPMAQDFYKLFHLGEDSLGISTIDPDGIALAAIQELQKQNEQLKKELNELRSLVEKMAVNSTSDGELRTAVRHNRENAQTSRRTN